MEENKEEQTTREPIILITGANGEVGHGLIKYLSEQEHVPEIVDFDLNPLDASLRDNVKDSFVGNILDSDLLDKLHEDYEIDTIYATSSTREISSKHMHIRTQRASFAICYSDCSATCCA